jgi:hypothetical protein
MQFRAPTTTYLASIDCRDDVPKHKAPVLVPAGAPDARLPSRTSLTAAQYKDAYGQQYNSYSAIYNRGFNPTHDLLA